MIVYVVTIDEFVVGVYSTKHEAKVHTSTDDRRHYRIWKKKLVVDQ